MAYRWKICIIIIICNNPHNTSFYIYRCYTVCMYICSAFVMQCFWKFNFGKTLALTDLMLHSAYESVSQNWAELQGLGVFCICNRSAVFLACMYGWSRSICFPPYVHFWYCVRACIGWHRICMDVCFGIFLRALPGTDWNKVTRAKGKDDIPSTPQTMTSHQTNTLSFLPPIHNNPWWQVFFHF